LSERDQIIRASEIGMYTYCARAWWLAQVQGYRSANLAAMREGTTQHHAHGRSVEGYHRLRLLAVALLLLATMAFIAWLLLSVGR
jgi:hypothetical protein